MSFVELLSTLPPIDGINALILRDQDGQECARIENRPGSAASVRVYHALHLQFGEINASAAKLGLDWYAEYTDDARAFPGKHPNIDRLIPIAEQGAPALRCEHLS